MQDPEDLRPQPPADPTTRTSVPFLYTDISEPELTGNNPLESKITAHEMGVLKKAVYKPRNVLLIFKEQHQK